jgi:hypothetical protein
MDTGFFYSNKWTLGQKVETLLNKRIPAGYHEIEFNAQNLPSAVYFYRIQAGDFQDVKKMILLRYSDQ